MQHNMKLKIYIKLSLHSKQSREMRNVCANSKIRRMLSTVHVIFTNIIHNFVKFIDFLGKRVRTIRDTTYTSGLE